MSKFADHLWRDLAREHGPTLVHADRPEPGRARGAGFRPRRGALAGGTLGLAGIGAALVLVLSAGGAAAPPAYAVTANSNGSLTVNLDSVAGFPGANRKLAAMGANEHILFRMAKGPAAVSGAVSCVAAPQGATVSGPPVQLTVGPGVANTETIAAGNTGAGTWHVAACSRYNGVGDTANPGIAKVFAAGQGTTLVTVGGSSGNTGNTGG